MSNSTKRPNIVFLFADDWGKYASAYSSIEGTQSVNGLIHTPNFDRIATEGALFTNAFVPAPSCTPCRSSILSGTYFWETGLGAILEGAVWDQSIPSYPLMLENTGYHIGYTYKAWAPGKYENSPYGGERTRYEAFGNKFGEFSQNVTKLMATMNKDEAKSAMLNETRNNFLSFLQDVPDDSPFCYWWGPVNTHREWQQGSGKELWGLNPDRLEGRMPEFLPDVHEVREDFNDYLGEAQAFDAGAGVILEELENAGLLENTLVVMSGDHGIPGFPRAKCNLYDFGSQVALAAMWPDKIRSGQLINTVVNLMSLAPTFLDAAGEPIPSNMAESLLPLVQNNADYSADATDSYVILGRERHVGYAREGGLPYPSRAIRTKDFLYIRNFTPDRWPMGSPDGLEDPNVTNTEEILEKGAYSYYYMTGATRAVYGDWDGGPTKQWILLNRSSENVKPNFDLCFGKRPAEELYDIQKDPNHMINLANDLSLSKVKKTLQNRLYAELIKRGDPRMTEEGECRFDIKPYAGPVDISWYGEQRDSSQLSKEAK